MVACRVDGMSCGSLKISVSVQLEIGTGDWIILHGWLIRLGIPGQQTMPLIAPTYRSLQII